MLIYSFGQDGSRRQDNETDARIGKGMRHGLADPLRSFLAGARRIEHSSRGVANIRASAWARAPTCLHP